MKTAEDEEFERIEAESGWRKRQIEQSEMCSNYGGFCKKEWVGLTKNEQSFVYDTLKNSTTRIDSFWVDFANAIEKALKDKNT